MEQITDIEVDTLINQPTILKVRVTSGEVKEFELRNNEDINALLNAEDLTDEQVAKIANAGIKGIDANISTDALREVIDENYDYIYEDYIHYDGLGEHISEALSERDSEVEKLLADLEERYDDEIEELNDIIIDSRKLLVELGEGKLIKYRDKVSLLEVLSKDSCIEGMLFFHNWFGTDFMVTIDNVKKLHKASPEYFGWAVGEFIYETDEVQDFYELSRMQAEQYLLNMGFEFKFIMDNINEDIVAGAFVAAYNFKQIEERV